MEDAYGAFDGPICSWRAPGRGVHEAYLECPEFYLGAISPDAMHVRFHNDKSHKDEFHLGNWGSVHVERVHEYWREHFTPFDVGYGVHALTDGYWVPSVKGDFSRSGRFPRAMCSFPPCTITDVRQTDFRLYAEHPDRPRIFALLRVGHPGPRITPCSPPPNFPSGGTTQFCVL